MQTPYNAQQSEAILYDKGGVLVLAGAGTGKTRVLTGRIIYLLNEKKVHPSRILAVTFTNKAAQEMKTRVFVDLPTAPTGLMLGTFHSICHRILRVHANLLGLDRNFQILDSQDQLSFLRRVMRDNHIGVNLFTPEEARHFIVFAKEKGIRAKQRLQQAQTAKEKQLGKVYELYERTSHQESKLDFSELMLSTMDLWHQRPEIREHYAHRFQYILVDEMQDTNRQQFQFLELLDSDETAFMGVGDDDQSIYSFRGSEPKILKEFQDRFRANKLIRLEKNYRSTHTILNAANAIIAHNQNRLGKTLESVLNEGEKLSVNRKMNDIEEASSIGWDISTKLKAGVTADEFAIFYRTNAQSRLLEKAMMERGIPYKIYGGLRFYDRQEIKHCLAYLRLLAGNDRDALLRVINFPPRGVGAKTIEQLAQGGNIFLSVQESEKSNLSHFWGKLEKWREQKETQALTTLVQMVLEDSGLLAHYESKNELERCENLKELVNAVAEYEQMVAEDENRIEQIDLLSEFLSTVALASGGEESQSLQAVHLMTIHAAKGLEFNRVFVVGLEEGLFPHANASSANAIEEERRLMYVAMTRARHCLNLYFADQRMLYGQTSYSRPSRFLNEIPEAYLCDRLWKNSQAMSAPKVYPNKILRQSNMDEKKSSAIRPGDTIFHERYGNGVVLRCLGEGKEKQADITFKRFGVKSFKLALAPLRKV